jgi:AraC family transcriptional regulator
MAFVFTRRYDQIVDAIRKTLFASDALTIGAFAARPTSDGCGEVERQVSHTVVLPVSGVFSRHDAPSRHVTGTPSHAVLVAADTPYRISYPGAIGDRALTLRFDHPVDELHEPRGAAETASHGLLPPGAIILRNLLWTRLQSAEADGFAVEALGLDLLDLALTSMRAGGSFVRRSAQVRWMRALARVKEAVAVAPAERWSVAKLAKVANLSPFHLCHVFRHTVGTAVYDYVVQERLARSLDAVLDGGDITTIALDAGFASHSHFTARFRKFFGCTPTALRRAASAANPKFAQQLLRVRMRTSGSKRH